MAENRCTTVLSLRSVCGAVDPADPRPTAPLTGVCAVPYRTRSGARANGEGDKVTFAPAAHGSPLREQELVDRGEERCKRK